MTIESPSIEYGLLSPMIVVLAAAVIGVLVEAFVPGERRRVTQVILSLGSRAVAFVAVIAVSGTRAVAAAGSIVVDGPT
ncbi:MAG: NADH-quinone oxidoreductase subunit N, partial [Rhodococcus sp. (in: high G+C Gram-positive bacteria)]